jgi:hypothetical protein
VTVHDCLGGVLRFCIDPRLSLDNSERANKPSLKPFRSRNHSARDNRKQSLKDGSQERYFPKPKLVRSLLAMVRQELVPYLGILQQVGTNRTPKNKSCNQVHRCRIVDVCHVQRATALRTMLDDWQKSSEYDRSCKNHQEE